MIEAQDFLVALDESVPDGSAIAFLPNDTKREISGVDLFSIFDLPEGTTIAVNRTHFERLSRANNAMWVI